MLTNQQTRSAFFDFPLKAYQWKADYLTQLTNDNNEYLWREFEAEIDSLMTPALDRAYREGLITKEELVSIGGRVWEIWADFYNEATKPKGGLWSQLKEKINSFIVSIKSKLKE